MPITIFDQKLEDRLYAISKRITFNSKYLDVSELTKKSIIEFVNQIEREEIENGNPIKSIPKDD